jgi:hypothetical protein
VSKPHCYHDQPQHLEDVLNDINEELYTTEHGLSFGAASMLRFLATIAWTSTTDHPERYSTINPKYARTAAMAQMTGASVSSVKRYLKELDGTWIKRKHQYGRDGFRDEDKIWLLWSDADRKKRADLIGLSKPGSAEKILAGKLFQDIGPKPKQTYDNRYWVNRKTGQFWRHDNPEHKVDDREELVTLSSEEAVFIWSKDRPMGMDTTKRRKIMKLLATHGGSGHYRLGQMMDEYKRRKDRYDAA